MRSAARVIDELQTTTGEYPVAAVVHELERAKRLRLTGEHVSNVITVLSDATVVSAPGRLRSVPRRRSREGAALIFIELMRVAGVSSGDVAAALDMPAQRIAEMRSGARPVAFEHLLLMLERLPEFGPAFRQMVCAIVEVPR